MSERHPYCMSPRCGCEESCAVEEAVKEAVDAACQAGMVRGLEMAAKYLDMASGDEAKSMIKSAILTIKDA